ncbi:hypothetical protein ACHHYP_00115 [Achlya hypogyna]|uniref:Integrator complex subunit 5 C-terminal domain-containing protein n=1 Tax=Achlya hypogyna TaxID=1202772 RepID=A0A1V9ZBD1_ACHHY|nr:hypothetical protein ACHHYP_00115 [Achlya hypogyna]
MTLTAPDPGLPEDMAAQFQSAIKKYMQVKGKMKKTRPKKQPRLGSDHIAAQAPPDMEAIQRCVWQLQEPLNCEPLTSATLANVLMSTLQCLLEAHQAIPLSSLLGFKDDEASPAPAPARTTIHAANAHPVYSSLLAVLRRLVATAWCGPNATETFDELLQALASWINADAPTWLWLLPFVGTVAPQPLVEFALRSIATYGYQTLPCVIVTLEDFLTPKAPLHIVSAAASVASSLDVPSLCTLLDVAKDLPGLVRVCDAAFPGASTAGQLAPLLTHEAVRTRLFALFTARASELVETPVELVRLLEDLSASPFHAEFLAYLPTNAQFLGRIVAAVAHLLLTLPPSTSPASFHSYIWPLVGAHGDATQAREVCAALLPLEDGPALCGQLLPHLSPASVASIVELLATAVAAGSTHQTRRALQVLRRLVPPAGEAAPAPLPSVAAQLATMAQWRAASGAAHWHTVLRQAASADAATADLALQLLRELPYPTLEDPVWQYACIYKLLELFFRRLLTAHDGAPLDDLRTVLATIVRDGGGVAAYPASVATTFLCLFVDAVLSAQAPTTIPHRVLREMNFFQPDDDSAVGGSSHVFRKLSAANTLMPYDPFPALAAEPSVPAAAASTVLGQLQAGRTKWADSALPAPSMFEATLQTLHREKMARAAACCLQAKALLLATEPDWNCLVDLLLERMLPVTAFMPSDDQYRDLLPERSNFDVDIRMEQWLLHYPIVVTLLQCVVEHGAPTVVLRTLPLLKSMLVVLIHYWHARRHQRLDEPQDEATPPYLHMRHQLSITLDVMAVLEKTRWLPEPLHAVGVLFPRVQTLDIRSLLHAIWLYLSDHPPTKLARETGNMEYYLMPLQNAVHRNIASLGPLYAQFA